MIRVCLFGKFSDFLDGKAALAVPAEGITTVADLYGYFAAQMPALHAEITSPQVLVAVNQQIVADSAALGDGDEVGFLPPVTGG